MENNELKDLIVAFKEYRNLIEPIEQSLKSFALSFDSIKNDMQNLNAGFDGSVQSKLDKIYKELSSQADKAKTLSGEVDKFMSYTNRYVASVENLINVCGRIENKINAVDSLESKAEEQIKRLDNIVEEKKKSYDLRQLERNLQIYNVGVEKVAQYINKDVADTLKENSDRISQIQDKSTNLFEIVSSEKESIDKLAESYNNSSELLRKVVEKNDVNEEYIFEILDKWAEIRKIKTKK